MGTQSHKTPANTQRCRATRIPNSECSLQNNPSGTMIYPLQRHYHLSHYTELALIYWSHYRPRQSAHWYGKCNPPRATRNWSSPKRLTNTSPEPRQSSASNGNPKGRPEFPHVRIDSAVGPNWIKFTVTRSSQRWVVIGSPHTVVDTKQQITLHSHAIAPKWPSQLSHHTDHIIVRYNI